MAIRTGPAARAWGRAQITKTSAPTSTGNWYRWCKVFVRMCFNVPSDGTPDAGRAWDRAKFKHVESDPKKIPADVPVFWELPSVADHVAYSTGGGMCLSNDILREGRVDEVPIDLITRKWGGRLLGWTEDIDSKRVYEAPTPPNAPSGPTRVSRARADVLKAIARLKRAEAAGRSDAAPFRRALRAALKGAPKR